MKYLALTVKPAIPRKCTVLDRGKFLSLASRKSVLGKSVIGLGLGFFVSLALVLSLLSSTPPLLITSLKAETKASYLKEAESSRIHFKVLGLVLESQVLGLYLKASSPQKLLCPELEDSTIFGDVKIL